jgi:hypothetical protein
VDQKINNWTIVCGRLVNMECGGEVVCWVEKFLNRVFYVNQTFKICSWMSHILFGTF